jgi:hypothetical protein
MFSFAPIIARQAAIWPSGYYNESLHSIENPQELLFIPFAGAHLQNGAGTPAVTFSAWLGTMLASRQATLSRSRMNF